MGDPESHFYLDQLKGSVAYFTFYENQPLADQDATEPKKASPESNDEE
jgi:hypothetical protein